MTGERGYEEREGGAVRRRRGSGDWGDVCFVLPVCSAVRVVYVQPTGWLWGCRWLLCVLVITGCC